jgi:acyl carrier protein
MSRCRVPPDITAAIRQVLAEYARLPVDVGVLLDESDLYAAGLTSHATIGVMLALEERFGVEFPERMLRRGAFASIGSIRTNLGELLGRGV